MKTEKQKIVVGMSGGVDSSMSLVLLKNQGWQPVGVSLKYAVWKSKKNILRENVCCSRESFQVAKDICQKLSVPHYVIDISKNFKKQVIDYFISELKNNRTPSPCIICNRHLKFKKLFEFAKKHKIDYVATGHYAKIRKVRNTYQLLRAKDKIKDQTYSLCFLPQKWLKNIVFPLGSYIKEQVYQMARKEKFDWFLKTKQSQDFCFVAGKSLQYFLESKLGKKPGQIMNTEGNILGTHQGLHFYTIGQRKKIGLSGGPYFVKAFDVKKNTLIVTGNKKEISQKEILLSPCRFISGQPIKKRTEVMAKTRSSQKLAKAVLFPLKNEKLKIVFNKLQLAVTPGQFCVFYQGQVCLGGGVIN